MTLYKIIESTIHIIYW